MIGTVELLSIVSQKLSLTGGFWGWVSRLDLNVVGFAIVGLFAVTWVVALAVWRYARIEERWALSPAGSGGDRTPKVG